MAALLLVRPATAQEAGTTGPQGKVAAEPIREQEPVHFRDKDGNLVPVLGYTLDDFDALLDLKNQSGRGQMRPRYTIQRMTGEGKAGESSAELKVEFEVLITASGWIRVPLRLGEVVLIERGAYDGPTKHFMEFEGPSTGYAAWFWGEGEQLHRLSIKALAPLENVAGKQKLRLTTPRSTQSELKLAIPLPQAEANVTGGGLLDRAARRPGGKVTELQLRALDGELSLTWWPKSRTPQATTPDLEAIGSILTQIDGRNLRNQATFVIRSSSGEYRFDGFRVKMPLGAAIVPIEQPGIRINAPSPNDKEPVAEIQLDEPTVGPVEVRLHTERTHHPTRPDEYVELAGFEVLDAVRQWGNIGVQVGEQWQITWSELHSGVRRIEKESLPDGLKQDDLAAGFEYAGKSFSLPARIIQRQTRIAVEPQYEVRVDSSRIHLKARLKYRVPGAKVFAVEVDLRGWETESDRVGPATLVDQDQIAPQVLEPLSIPLLQPTKGEFEIVIEAWRNLPADARQIDFHLPHPTAHNLSLAPVVVLPADNVSIVPRGDSLVGLKAQALPRKHGLGTWQQEPLFFLCDVVQGYFAGDISLLPRTVAVAVTSDISLEEQEGRVEQKFAYRVAHEPLDRVLLTAPRALAEANQLEVSLAGRPLSLVRGPDESPSSATVALRALLADEQGKLSERIGNFEIVVRYPVASAKLLPEASASLDLPLVMPADGTLTSNKVSIASPPGIKVHHREGPWKLLDTASQRLEQSPGLRLSAADRLNSVPVALHLEASNAAASTVVERCWIQSQLAGNGRQDRAVYRFTTNQGTFELGLPKQVVFNDVSVLLDGQPAAVRVGSDRRISVAIAKDQARRPHLLELNYRFAGRDSTTLDSNLEAPLLDPEVWVRRTYWQVVLSPQEHVVTTPAGFIGEFTWAWNGLYFGRRPVLDQAQLEQWCGSATTRRADLPTGSNVYLFSVLGAAPGLSLWTAGRTGLVFFASLACLASGLLLIYAPKLRTPLLLTLIVTVAGLGLVYPEPVLLLLEAGSLGVALALVAMLLERIVAPRRTRAAPLRRQSSSIVDRGLLHSPLQPAGGAHSSTRTAAIVASAASPEQVP